MEIAQSIRIERLMMIEHATSVHASAGKLFDPLDEDFDPPSDVNRMIAVLPDPEIAKDRDRPMRLRLVKS